MANSNCDYKPYRDSLQKCLVIFGVSRLQFSELAGVSRETLREFLDKDSEPYERTMHKIIQAMKWMGWVTDAGSSSMLEIEGKKFTVSELKSLISSAK
jgi:lambda repressor-like predicted transcriptional regulator